MENAWQVSKFAQKPSSCIKKALNSLTVQVKRTLADSVLPQMQLLEGTSVGESNGRNFQAKLVG